MDSMTSRFFTLSVALTLAVLLCTCGLRGVATFPRGVSGDGGEYDGQHLISKRDECSSNIGVRILCERCAKYTKSNLAYKMCCDSNNEEVQTWCKAFLEYDITSK